ncbi:MAG TPA: AAA family ATPase [Candidatus Limnocylindria bacterium]|jgi:adenylate kinase family enzyme
MRRVSVVGTVGSGKTTFARALARKLDVPYVELDALHWGPGWTPADDGLMRERVAQAIAGDAWVIDGNYWRKIGGLVWTRADTVVWLDPPWLLTFIRVLLRTIRRSLGRAELFGGNRETLREAFLSRKSILLFAIRTVPGRRRIGEERLAQPEYAHLAVHRFRSQAAADRWLASVPAASEPQPR